MDHIQGQTFEDDKLMEALDEHSVYDEAHNRYIDSRTGRPVLPLFPLHTIRLDGLDEKRILAWWRKFNFPGRDWSTLGQNCSTTVGRALMIGSGDDYAIGISGWWHSWNMVWKPDDVLRYARAIQNGLALRRGRHRAINFVRRFCTSPLGFTSLTWNMDEEGLAKALYRELGTNTKAVADVFRELDGDRNADADDVAEIYVGLLMTKKGAPLAAVAKDEQLRELLIKILDEGWTTRGEERCIQFLRSLG